MTNRVLLGRSAAKTALSLRKKLAVPYTVPICPFDAAEKLGLDVWWRPETSLEGLYVKDPATIIVSNCRPYGRRRYNCAHELGHHQFDHGTRVDLIDAENKNDPEEILADSFAGHFLVPAAAFRKALADRTWHPEQLTALQLLRLSHYFGVGYSTLISHAAYALKQLPHDLARECLKAKPIELRSAVLGERTARPTYFLDRFCASAPLDVETGDLIVVPSGSSCEGTPLSGIVREDRLTVFQANTPGLARVFQANDWACFVRVSRAGYSGLARFRHLEDQDE